MEEIWAMDLGVKKSVLDGKGTVSVSLNDIFKTRDWTGVMNYGGLKMKGVGGNDTRQVRIGFSYRLGNQKVKASRNRKTGLEEEKSRIGSN